MITNRRKRMILDYFSEADYRTIQDLADRFNVSENTIRRDINELAKDKYVKKFYGGVSLIKKTESNYDLRLSANIAQKEKIAKYAATLVNDHDLIFIDSGTTTPLILDYLNTDHQLTIVSNNLHVICHVVSNPNWDLIVLGTSLNHSTHSLINIPNWDYVNSLNLNKAFLATTGLTLKSGATNPFRGEADIKSSMIKKSSKSILLMDSSKFDQTSLITYAAIDDFTQIITSGIVPDEFVHYFKTNDINYKCV